MKYKKEELIYESIKDVSDVSRISNNIIRVRIIRRLRVKPRNIFRRLEKHVVYYDIEYTTPETHELKCEATISAVVNDIRREENREYISLNCAAWKAFEEEMWKAENFCLKYKTNRNENGNIRKRRIENAF